MYVWFRLIYAWFRADVDLYTWCDLFWLNLNRLISCMWFVLYIYIWIRWYVPPGPGDTTVFMIRSSTRTPWQNRKHLQQHKKLGRCTPRYLNTDSVWVILHRDTWFRMLVCGYVWYMMIYGIGSKFVLCYCGHSISISYSTFPVLYTSFNSNYLLEIQTYFILDSNYLVENPT